MSASTLAPLIGPPNLFVTELFADFFSDVFASYDGTEIDKFGLNDRVDVDV